MRGSNYERMVRLEGDWVLLCLISLNLSSPHWPPPNSHPLLYFSQDLLLDPLIKSSWLNVHMLYAEKRTESRVGRDQLEVPREDCWYSPCPIFFESHWQHCTCLWKIQGILSRSCSFGGRQRTDKCYLFFFFFQQTYWFRVVAKDFFSLQTCPSGLFCVSHSGTALGSCLRFPMIPYLRSLS